MKLKLSLAAVTAVGFLAGCATGRSYSSEDISRTGANTAAGALQLLDPSITVRL